MIYGVASFSRIRYSDINKLNEARSKESRSISIYTISCSHIVNRRFVTFFLYISRRSIISRGTKHSRYRYKFCRVMLVTVFIDTANHRVSKLVTTSCKDDEIILVFVMQNVLIRLWMSSL